MDWQQINKQFEGKMLQHGFDVIVPLTCKWYNQIVPNSLQIALNDSANDDCLVVMIGNTKKIWPHFIKYSYENYTPETSDPFDQFVVKHINKLILELDFTPTKVYWAHKTEPGELIAIQKMLVASGFSYLCDVTKLCIHPVYGSWFGMRSVLIFEQVKGPTKRQFPASNNIQDLASTRRNILEENMKIALATTKEDHSWENWVKARISLYPEHPFMYTMDQLFYHYNHRRIKSFYNFVKHIFIKGQSIDYFQPFFSGPSKRVMECRDLITTVLQELNEKYENKIDAIILSGGLDTSILSECTKQQLGSKLDRSQYNTPILKTKIAITVQADPIAKDGFYAASICKKLKISHSLISCTVQDLLETAGAVSRILRSFDPMELRNSIVIYRALKRASSLGCKVVVTGDGADEIFAGYSFMHNMPEEKLDQYRQNMMKIMSFTAPKLAKEFGIEVLSPFLDHRIQSFAKNLTKHDLIGHRTPIPDGELVYGKLILRQAFPEITSQYRRKEPIEVGAGTSALRSSGYFDEILTDEDFTAAKRRIFDTDGVFLRDKEHYVFYQSYFERNIGQLRGESIYDPSQKCPGCGFLLDPKETQDFCTVCGLWPCRITATNNLNGYAQKSIDEIKNF